MRRSFYFFLLWLMSIPVLSQEFGTLDTNPTSLRWKQIHTEHFRVLFPLGFETQAQRMANSLEAMHAPEAKSLGTLPRKISVVLQNQSALSNGFVSIMPRRSEFYAMPSQNYNFTGTNDWLDMLASHEYRHIVQFQHAKRGFNKLAYTFFGNTGLGALAYITVPQWFWEGDAVATETAFTPSGRGRIPNFDLLLRTNIMEGRIFNYDKQYLRSFRHNIPNHYVLGYHMVSHLRKQKNDADVWGRITAKAWSNSFLPFQFNRALKKESGLNLKNYYQAMATELKATYQKQLDSLQLTRFETMNQRSSTVYTDYQYPQPLTDGSILTVKSGIGDIDRLVAIKDGQEQRVYTLGFLNESGMLSVANNRVVWNEYRNDPRWQVRNYSAIVGYDFNTKLRRTITKQSRYAGAALSPDGSQVATIETTTEYATRLVIVTYDSGSVVKIFDNPENDFLSMPRWTADGKEIVLLRTNKQGRTIAGVSVESGVMTNLTSLTQENIGHPVPVGNYILFNSPGSGIDNIYALDRSTGNRFQITCSKYGAYNPSVSLDGKWIYYNEQMRDGMDVVKVPFQPEAWKSWTKAEEPFPLAAVLAKQEEHPALLNSIPNIQYPVKSYSKLSGLLNPYSWGAFVDNTLAQATIGIASRDVLSTTAINAGYEYDINEKTGQWKAGVSVQTFYPIVDFQVVQGSRKENTSILDRDVNFKWKEQGMIGGLRIPLLYSVSKYQTQFEISNSIGLSTVSSFENEVSDANGTIISRGTNRFVFANDTLIYGFTDRVDGQLMYNRFIFSFAHAMKQSKRDINPAFAQYLTYENYTSAYATDYQGSLSAWRAALYFPGFFKHHSIFFRAAYQQSLESSDGDIYSFRNRIFKPRGHSYPRNSKFTSFAANYQLPIFYPDIVIGPLAYVQRIKANFFYDYGQGEGRTYFYRPLSGNRVRTYFSDNAATYQSFGTELTFDVNVFRLLPILEVGVRATYLQANKYTNSGWVYELMLANIPF